MKDENLISIEDLLKNPEVEKAASNINQELIERRKYIPPECEVFTSSYTVLKDNEDFKFSIHREARKQLPDIINNKVQSIVGLESPEEPFKQRYGKKYTIGIVFSGGPAPGGHNVIAGLYDAAKKANPETKIFGFILGPDGIIENETIEISGPLVDSYRNLGGFTMIKTGRAKIDTPKKMALSIQIPMRRFWHRN